MLSSRVISDVNYPRTSSLTIQREDHSHADLKPLSVLSLIPVSVRRSNGSSALRNRSEQINLPAFENRTGNLYTCGL